LLNKISAADRNRRSIGLDFGRPVPIPSLAKVELDPGSKIVGLNVDAL